MVYLCNSVMACARLMVVVLIVLLAKLINSLTINWLLCALCLNMNCKWWLVIVVTPHMIVL
jgi:hypothetical protein